MIRGCIKVVQSSYIDIISEMQSLMSFTAYQLRKKFNVSKVTQVAIAHRTVAVIVSKIPFK